MKKIVGKDLENELEPLEIALPNNVTTEMGLVLFSISKLLPEKINQKELEAGIKHQTLPQAFLSAWQEFMHDYGFRGPQEIDVAAPRYQDEPGLIINLLLTMHTSKDNPQENFDERQLENEKIFKKIYQEMQKRNDSEAKRFAFYYKIHQTFAGYRETHKLYLVFVTDLLRQKIVGQGEAFVSEKRLESIDQVFSLTLEELDQAKHDATFNLLGRVKVNQQEIDQLAKIPNLPTLIDSRGLILRPPSRGGGKHEVKGNPISRGVYRGRIKVLHQADEKPLKKGEILVARATDPGWTPLFVNAGALILEIGGTLQHGALVAREYGLPCVAGIENATNLWKDGTLVEVDGAAGIIRMIKENK